MKSWSILALVIVLGLAIGVGAALMRVDFGSSGSSAPTTAPAAPDNGLPPKVRVDQIEFDFGELERNGTGFHSFKFINEGLGPLKLSDGGTTCTACTIAEVSTDPIPPGGSTEVVIKYHPTAPQSTYRQQATIRTNDPARPEVVLTITGKLVESLTITPWELVFNNLTGEEQSRAEVRLETQMSSPALEITQQSLENRETAKFFEIASKPLPAAELGNGAKSGILLTVVVKPGLPFGAIQQKIRLLTNLPGVPERDVYIRGNVTNGVSVFGKGWSADLNALKIGSISQSKGEKRTLRLLVRGPKHKEIVFSNPRVDPEFLKVTLGEKTEIEKVSQIPLTIEIPAGSPPTVRMGSAQGKMATVTLDSNDEKIGAVKLNLQFAIVADE